MKIKSFLSIFLLVSLPLLAHKAYRANIQEIIESATVVGIGIIEKKQMEESRCSTKFSFLIKPVELLQGDLKEESLEFNYIVLFPRKADYFWQKDCASVHYYLPSVAQKMEKGEKVIFTAEKKNDKAPVRITSAFDLDKLGAIKELLEKKKKK